MMSFKILFLFFALFSARAFGMTDIGTKIHNVVERNHKQLSFHGNVMVKQGDRVVYKNSFGLADDSFDIPHTMESRFMIASVSKQFTAALILILAQEGLIDIYSPYGRYVDPPKNISPGNREKWERFTIYELLTHTAGFYKDVRRTNNYHPEVYEPFMSLIIREQFAHYDVFVCSEKEVRYSNFGYMLLAHLAEKVTGKTYENLLREKIFAPLGMDSSGEYHRMKNIKFMAEGHLYSGHVSRLRKRCCHDATSFRGAYSLYSDVGDMMAWLDNLDSEYPAVLTKESVTIMTRSHFEMGSYAKGISYGLGFYVDEFDGNRRYWHDGFEYGYLSFVSVIPEKKLKIVILSNRHRVIDELDSHQHIRKMNDEILRFF